MRQTQITDWSQVPLILDLPFTARLLGVSIESLKKRCQSGTLPGAFKLDGGHWRVSKNALRRYIEGDA